MSPDIYNTVYKILTNPIFGLIVALIIGTLQSNEYLKKMLARIFLSCIWLLVVFGAWNGPAESAPFLYRFMIAALVGVALGTLFLLYEIQITRWSVRDNSQTSVVGGWRHQIKQISGPEILLILLFLSSTGVLVWVYLDQGNDKVNTTYAVPDPEQVKSEVQKKILLWKSLSEARDLESNLKNYADRVEYYKDTSASRDDIRRYKQTDSAPYDTIRFNLSDLSITPDPKGEKATVVFVKECNFTGSGKPFTGKVRQQLRLEKINGQWLITAEKDLKPQPKDN